MIGLAAVSFGFGRELRAPDPTNRVGVWSLLALLASVLIYGQIYFAEGRPPPVEFLADGDGRALQFLAPTLIGLSIGSRFGPVRRRPAIEDIGHYSPGQGAEAAETPKPDAKGRRV